MDHAVDGGGGKGRDEAWREGEKADHMVVVFDIATPGSYAQV